KVVPRAFDRASGHTAGRESRHVKNAAGVRDETSLTASAHAGKINETARVCGDTCAPSVASTLKGYGVIRSEVGDIRAARVARVRENDGSTASGRGVVDSSAVSAACASESDSSCKEIVANDGIASVTVDESN